MSFHPIHSVMKSLKTIKESTRSLARELQVIGLMNIQYAVKNDVLYVLEVNPRASRTVPFVSKATGVAWAKIASMVMAGKKLSELGVSGEYAMEHIAVKESVFPFNRFPGIDPVLGPEMKSTGEVMGIDRDFGRAYAKSQIAAGQILPVKGNVFISVRNQDKRSLIYIAKKLVDLGFSLLATSGTAKVLANNGLTVKSVLKITEGRPNIADMIKNGDDCTHYQYSIGTGGLYGSTQPEKPCRNVYGAVHHYYLRCLRRGERY